MNCLITREAHPTEPLLLADFVDKGWLVDPPFLFCLLLGSGNYWHCKANDRVRPEAAFQLLSKVEASTLIIEADLFQISATNVRGVVQLIDAVLMNLSICSRGTSVASQP